MKVTSEALELKTHIFNNYKDKDRELCNNITTHVIEVIETFDYSACVKLMKECHWKWAVGKITEQALKAEAYRLAVQLFKHNYTYVSCGGLTIRKITSDNTTTITLALAITEADNQL